MSQILGIGSGGGGGTNVTVVPYTLISGRIPPYPATETDYVIGIANSGIPLTILLPDAPAIGRVFIVKDVDGSANVDDGLTVTTVSGIVKIDRNINYIINNNYQSATFIFNGTSYGVF